MIHLRELVRVLQGRQPGKAEYYEPRLWWDAFVFDGTVQTVHNNPNIFVNAEKREIRVHTILAAASVAAEDQQTPPGGDERIVQRYGMRIFTHGTYYQNDNFVDLPLWHNQPVAAADPVTMAMSTWRFPHPVLLGRRGSFDVRIIASLPIAAPPVRAEVAFDGVGLLSRQPKRLVGGVDLSNLIEQSISPDDFRNDGVEPLEIHAVTLFARPPVATADPMGVVRNVRMRLKMTSDYSEQWWVVGPSTPTLNVPQAPGVLWGGTVGRAITHKIPGDGWFFAPGEGVDIEIQSNETTRTDSILVALLGETLIT